jgi:hypothetical protein
MARLGLCADMNQTASHGRRAVLFPMRLPANSRRLRPLIAGCAAAMALAVAPGVAHAATVSIFGGKLVYAAATGEANNVTIAPWGFSLRVTEAGTKAKKPLTLTAGPGCSQLSTTEAACTGFVFGATVDLGDGDDFLDATTIRLPVTASGGTGNDTIATGQGNDTLDGGSGTDTLRGGAGSDTVTYASATAPVTAALGGSAGNGASGENDTIAADVENLTGGPGDDTLTGDGGPNVLSGGAGNDTLDGGAGADTLDGGAGNDTFAARDGEVDSLLCGDGQDGGSADTADVIGSDCEAVVVPGAPLVPGTVDPGTDPGTVTGPAGLSPTPNAVPPTIPPQTVPVSASGVARVRIICPPDSGGCRGVLTIELPRARAAGTSATAARRTKSPRLGRARFTAKAGTVPTIPVRLSKRGRQRILRGGRSQCRISVTTVSAEGKAVVTTRPVTLTAARRRPPRPSKGRR